MYSFVVIFKTQMDQAFYVCYVSEIHFGGPNGNTFNLPKMQPLVIR